jgi:hypothetical protein
MFMKLLIATAYTRRHEPLQAFQPVFSGAGQRLANLPAVTLAAIV